MPLFAKPVSKFEKVQMLLLDGNERAAGLMHDILSNLGFSNIQVVKDGYEGIQAMKKKRVHLVITDRELRVRKRRPLGNVEAAPSTDENMLPLSGTEFVKRLRQSPRSPNPFVSVVMVVNQNAEEYIAEARDAGVNEIITLPLQASELCQRITSLIDDKRHFITANTYKGPCRRRQETKPIPGGTEERRKKQIRLVRRGEARSM